jgi:TPR repeat protein
MKNYIKVLGATLSLIFMLPVLASESALKNDDFSTEVATLMSDSFTTNPDHLCASDNCLKLFKKLKKYASWGNPEAQVLVAAAYLSGNGLEVNEQLAVRNLRKAVKSGSNRARWMMSYLYKHGVGIAKDLDKSGRLLNKAVKYDYPPALFQKATEIIDFATMNNEDGVAMLAAAAKKRHKASMYLLAKMYQHGKGIAADKFEAAKLYKKLAFSGYKDSHQRLESVLNAAKENEESSEEMLAFSSDIEVIQVIGEKWNMELALEYKVKKMSKSQIYDGKSYFSHLRGRTCLNSSSKCISINGEDVDGFMRSAMVDVAKAHAIALR